MFGMVSANYRELNKEQRSRYGSVYCGICRRIHASSSQAARLVLSYDMAFLALLHMSLYEPEELSGKNHCLVHPLTRKAWVDNESICYAGDMNILLAYYKALDDWQDEKKQSARWLSGILLPHAQRIASAYPRQAQAIRESLARLSRLEEERCPNPDEPAAAFGALMGELLVLRQDHWAGNLRNMGDALGRYIYLADAMEDYDSDLKKGSYNPFLAMGSGKDPQRWREYLVLTMGRCTDYYERLPLVQDKAILDNILYSGIWLRKKAGKEGESHE